MRIHRLSLSIRTAAASLSLIAVAGVAAAQPAVPGTTAAGTMNSQSPTGPVAAPPVHPEPGTRNLGTVPPPTTESPTTVPPVTPSNDLTTPLSNPAPTPMLAPTIPGAARTIPPAVPNPAGPPAAGASAEQ